MGKVNVTIIDATGNKSQNVTLPDDAPIGRIIGKLVQMMNLPVTDPGGGQMSYKFNHKQSGMQLVDEQTLIDAGVKDGDVLRLMPEVTAG